MVEPLKLGRNLDPRNRSDLDELMRVIGNYPESVPMTIEDVRTGLEVLARLFPNAEWLAVDQYAGGALVIPTGPKAKSHFSLASAIQLGLRLNRFEQCEGFESLLSGFRNPTQFFDSVFEAEIADFCLSREGCQGLRFSPEYLVKGELKHPDFVVMTPRGPIVCECKRSHEKDRQYFKRFERIHNALDKGIKELGETGAAIRVEVHICQVVGKSVDQFAHDVAIQARQAAKASPNQILDYGPYKLCVVPRTSPTVFNEYNLARVSVTVGNTPVGITPEYAYLRVTTDQLDPLRARADGELMREARSQLPDTERCAIFLDAINGESAKLAAERRLGSLSYLHVVACGIWSSSGSQFVYRTSDKSLVEEIFGPFPQA